MKVRFLAGADLNKSILNGVLRREPSVDFQSAHEAGFRGMKDDRVLNLAAETQRVLVSHDEVSRTLTHFAKREFTAPVYFSFRRAWTSARRSTNSY